MTFVLCSCESGPPGSSVRRIKVPDEKAVTLEEKFALEAFEHGGVVGDGRIQNLQRDYPAGLAVADLPPGFVPPATQG